MPEEPLVVTISSGSGVSPDEMARKTFPVVRRGVDPEAVRQYLETVAAEVRGLLDREANLRRHLADAERRAAEPVLDEATLTKAVGLETARILQTAHDAAREVVERAEARATELVEEAERAAAERSAEAEAGAREVIEAAEQEAASLSGAALAEAASEREAARRESEELTGAARADAEALLDATKEECREMVHEARQLRTSVLQDLNERRRALFVQLEQLRSGRDLLVDVVDAVGEAVEGLRERLEGAEHDARVAAAEAGERAAADGGWDEIDEELEQERRRLAAEAEEAEDRELRAAALAEGVPSGELSDEALARELAVDEALAGELAAEPGAPAVAGADATSVGGAVETADGTDTAGAPAAGAAAGEERTEGTGDDEGTEEGAAAGQAGARSVDELFAMIRAGRSPDVPPAAPGESTAARGSEGVLGQASAHEAAVNEADEDAHQGEDDAGESASLEHDGDRASLARRTEALSPIETRLGRSVKRALQDDQNELLDALRHATGVPDLDRLLPVDQQHKRFEAAVSALLAEAWDVGRSWLGGEAPADRPSAAQAGAALAGELAKELSTQLRERLRRSFGGVTDGSDSATQDLASAAYRDWKGARVESLAGDFAVRAFSSGAVTGGADIEVRWVVDDEGRPCPDCDDNALAGPQPAGTPFPTGQVHPPVHPGCRCLLVAADS